VEERKFNPPEEGDGRFQAVSAERAYVAKLSGESGYRGRLDHRL